MDGHLVSTKKLHFFLFHLWLLIAYAHTWDPVSGITVKRAVSSSRRTQAIFSSEFKAAISLLKVRMFLSSVLNLMMGRTSTSFQLQLPFPILDQLLGLLNA